jgi:integrase/recombinase XerD
MIEALFKQSSTIARLQSAPLAEHFPMIIQVLQDERYRPDSIRKYVRVTEQFGIWLIKNGLEIASADETTLARYRSSISRRHKGQLRAAARGMPKILKLLRQVFSQPVTVPETEAQAILTAFDFHLEHVAGLASGTRLQHARYATSFVDAVFGAAPFDLSRITPQVAADFVQARASKLKPSACSAPASSIRVFLRFLTAHCGLPDGAAGAIPAIRQWKLASLPKHLSIEQVNQTMATCYGQSPVHRRDRAILLLLFRLGLRAGEAAGLRFSDVDWRAGELRVYSPKSTSERKLPIPDDVGRALSEYIQNGRPQSAQPYIFLHTRAPFSPISGSSTVSGIAKDHLRLAGISVRGLSSHAFRHTAATQMVRRGASFKQVADILGHRHLETTNIYAKLDEETLHQAALPWPGRQP